MPQMAEVVHEHIQIAIMLLIKFLRNLAPRIFEPFFERARPETELN